MAIERFRIDLNGNAAATDQRLHAGHRVADRSIDQPPQHERRARPRCLVDQALERLLGLMQAGRMEQVLSQTLAFTRDGQAVTLKD